MKAALVVIAAAILAVILAAGCAQLPEQPQQPPAQEQPSPPSVETQPTAPAPTVPTTPAAPATPLTGAEKIVEISATGFSPATVEVNTGDTVTWVNMDSVAHWPASAQHPTHTAYPETGGCIGSKFDACKNLTQGQSYTFTFNQPGEWKYHDHKNCCTDPRFFGTVIVKASTAVEAAKPAASVALTTAPKIAANGVEFSVSWKITSEPGTTSHTAVHYGRQSIPDPKSPADYAFASRIFCTATPCKVPSAFQAPITIQEDGIYYYRAHTIISGKHFWSDEAAINVSSAPEVVQMVTRPSGGGGGY